MSIPKIANGLFLLILILGSCNHYKQKGQNKLSASEFDSVSLHTTLDTMHLKALGQPDSVYCDSAFSLFNNPELFKQHPDMVCQAFKWSFICHGYSSQKNIDSFRLLLEKYPNDKLKPWITYWEARTEVRALVQNINETATLKFLDAYRQFQKQNNNDGIMTSCKWLGFLYMQSSEYEKAITYSKQALALAVDLEEIVILCSNISSSYENLLQYDSADYYLRYKYKVSGWDNTFHDLEKFYTYDYYRLGKRTEADSFFKKAIPWLVESKSFNDLPGSIKNYCLILINQKRFTEAEKYIQLGLANNDTADNWGLYKVANLIYDSLHNYPLAYKYAMLDRRLSEKKLVNSSTSDVESWMKKSEYAQKEQQLSFDKEIAMRELQAQRKQKYYFIAGSVLLLLIALLSFQNYRNQRKAKEESNKLLLNILPAEVAEELKTKGNAAAKHFNNVTVFFSDFKSFTTISEKLTPQQLVSELHECFSAFDNIMHKYNIEKIKTVGDAYLAVSGLPLSNPNHAIDVVNAALEVQQFMKARKMKNGGEVGLYDIRIGINSGSVVAGIVGVKKFAYDIWGDTVNTAARMEQNSEAGKVNISEATYELVKDQFNCQYRGEIEAKNKGKLKMYFVEDSS